MTSVILPRALRERAKTAAMHLHWSFGEVVRVALADWLDTHRIET